MHPNPKKVAPIVLIIVILVSAAWYLTRGRENGTSSALAASGTIEGTQVIIAPELGGRVKEVLAHQGDVVETKGVMPETSTKPNAADEQWRRERGAIGVWMHVRFGDQYGLARCWEGLAAAASRYSECSQGFYASEDRKKTHPDECIAEEKALNAALLEFSSAASPALGGADAAPR